MLLGVVRYGRRKEALRPMAVKEDFMESLSTETSVVSAPVRARPLAPSRDARLLASRIERAIQQETGRGVRSLNVEVGLESVVLTGFCHTYYCKQLAQHAAMSIVRIIVVINSIEVC